MFPKANFEETLKKTHTPRHKYRESKSIKKKKKEGNVSLHFL